MNKKLIALVGAVAVLAPASAFAMPVAAPASASFESAKIERAAVVIRTGRPAVRVVRPVRPAVRVIRPVRPAARVIVR